MDWTTATDQRILVPTFADRGVSHGQRDGNQTDIFLGFLEGSRYFIFQVPPHVCSLCWVKPVPDPLLLRKSGSTGNRTWDLWVCKQELWPLDHRSSLPLKHRPLYYQDDITIYSIMLVNNHCILFTIYPSMSNALLLLLAKVPEQISHSQINHLIQINTNSSAVQSQTYQQHTSLIHNICTIFIITYHKTEQKQHKLWWVYRIWYNKWHISCHMLASCYQPVTRICNHNSVTDMGVTHKCGHHIKT
jgi:hypothetical protein